MLHSITYHQYAGSLNHILPVYCLVLYYMYASLYHILPYTISYNVTYICGYFFIIT